MTLSSKGGNKVPFKDGNHGVPWLQSRKVIYTLGEMTYHWILWGLTSLYIVNVGIPWTNRNVPTSTEANQSCGRNDNVHRTTNN